MSRRTNPEKPQQQASLRTRALRLLARREHSRQELERRLAPHAEDAGVLQALLDELSRNGWLSDRRFVDHVARVRRGRFGSRRIRQELVARGVSGAEVDAATRELEAGDFEAARAVWQRKFGAPARDRRERARQVRFLQGRGFKLDTIMRVIDAECDGEHGQS